MKAVRILSVALAVFMCFAILASAGCGKKGGGHEDEVVIEAGLNNTPTKQPGESGESGSQSGAQGGRVDTALFDVPLSKVCALVESHTLENMKALYPEDYFSGMEQTLNETLSEAGISISALGYSSFDEMLAAALGELDFAKALNIPGVENIEKASCSVLKYEPADIEAAKTALYEEIKYLDMAKFGRSYKLNVDFTVEGSGKVVTNNTDITLYEYDGVFYVLFA